MANKFKCWKREKNSFLKKNAKLGEIKEINIWSPRKGVYYTTKTFKMKDKSSFVPTSTKLHGNKKSAIQFSETFIKKNDKC